jgi:threonylcarbamoyladenosine tRNA methylthiotransferase MtaB
MKVAVATLGCKVNQYESAGILEALEERGFTIVPFNTAADCYIVNTCTVTGRSDCQSRQLIRRAARANPGASIIVTGCYARIAPDEIRKIGAATRIMEAKASIPDRLQRIAGGMADEDGQDTQAEVALPELHPRKFPGHTRAFLKIQDGCNTFCAYCIVPYARGRSRSLPEKDVHSRILELSRAGFREIVLTGIHLGAYGQDLQPPSSLLGILKRAEERRPIERLRLSSLEPGEVTNEMIAFFRTTTLLCHHLHIPLQSGSDDVLKRMGRPYDSTFFRDRLERIWRAAPDMAIGLDVMAGFPGENERDFNRTLRLIEDLPVAYLHVFPYSDRPGTAAFRMPDKVGEKEKKIRAEQLRAVGKQKRAAFAGRFVGKKLAVLVEGGRDSRGEFPKGFSGQYIPVFIRTGGAVPVNRIVTVIAESCADGKLYGRTVHD